MPESLTATPESDFVCDCEEWMRSACAQESFYKEHEGKRYCVLHFPDKDKVSDFRTALQRKLDASDFDFGGVWFPAAQSFFNRRFEKLVNFRSAIFNGETDFRRVEFVEKSYFNLCSFMSNANFSSAVFGAKTYFSFANFRENIYFNSAQFSKGADFISTAFGAEAYFTECAFGARVNFSAPAYVGHRSVEDLMLPMSPQPTTFIGKADFVLAQFLKGADFSRTQFNADAYFSSAVFGKHIDDYAAAIRAGEDFKAEETFFISATFGRVVYFNHSMFNAEAFFTSATFLGDANFVFATFRVEAGFSFAHLQAKADFSETVFEGRVNFESATLDSYVVFSGSEQRPTFGVGSSLEFQSAKFERPGNFSFHTLVLRAGWFVNANPRELNFNNVQWQWLGTKKEIETLSRRHVSSPHRLLAIACRHLAVNAEENHRYEEASRFRYMAMETQRQERWRGMAFWRLSWWYWLASGYGERAARAFLVLLAIWFLFGLLYLQVPTWGWEVKVAGGNSVASVRPPTEQLRNALTYSAGIMTLQRPEPRPATTAAQSIVLLETILGPVQAALLALAIRRKFMR